jgi:Zn-dependent protease
MGSWKLGKAFGINIYVHWSFLLPVALVLHRTYDLGGTSLALFGLLVLFAAFGCVVLHELGHALMARRFGIQTRDITLYAIGGVARLERMSEKPWEEFCIALAGPAVNVAIAAILVVPATLSLPSVPSAQATLEIAPGQFLLALLWVNGLLVLFNMIPAFPMDGGRVLRALLVSPLGRLKATQVAATLGAVFAMAIVVWGIVNWEPIRIIIGIFVFFIGRQELAAVRYKETIRQAQPLDVLPADTEVLDALPVNTDEHFSGSVWDEQRRLCVIWRNGRPIYSYRLD